MPLSASNCSSKVSQGNPLGTPQLLSAAVRVLLLDKLGTFIRGSPGGEPQNADKGESRGEPLRPLQINFLFPVHYSTPPA